MQHIRECNFNLLMKGQMCPITGFTLLSVQLKAAHDSGILSYYKETLVPPHKEVKQIVLTIFLNLILINFSLKNVPIRVR